MKSLRDFIKESLEDKDIQNLEVIYEMGYREPIVIQAPETYSEDDLTLYFQDKVFEQLPGGKKLAQKFFGSNASKLIDVHIEYDSFQRDGDWDDNIDLEWDNEYDTKNSEKNELSYFVLDDVKYILSFESFKIKVENEGDIDNILHKIFDVTESSSMNEYPINLKLYNFKYDAQV